MNENAGPSLPLVVQIGFAGSRTWLDESQTAAIDLIEFESAIQSWLTRRLKDLPKELNLQPEHFLCGISAIAIGGDLIFCKACKANDIPLRIFLPQTRDEFFAARGSKAPDFSPQQREEVAHFLDSDAVIQEWLASDASDRQERFRDTNREIVRESDLLVCLLRDAEAESKGTSDLIGRAVRQGKPVLVIKVRLENGAPAFEEQWRLPQPPGKSPSNEISAVFDPPSLPRSLRDFPLAHSSSGASGRCTPKINEYATVIKNHSSSLAAAMHDKFRRMAILIIGTHIMATVLATIALEFSKFHLHILPLLLGLELLMLASGFFVHHQLHHSRTSHYWAEARLLAEVTRSVLAIDKLHMQLDHLFSLPFPSAVKPVLRTINVLQLCSTRMDQSPWEDKRQTYMDVRLIKSPKGQIPFYTKKAAAAAGLLNRLRISFNVFWVVALISTITEIVLHHAADHGSIPTDLLSSIAGVLAITMPVLAVGALSLAGALDLQAQSDTYLEMLKFLNSQVEHLHTATSERDYAKLVLETEFELLGETANWFSRRSFATVA